MVALSMSPALVLLMSGAFSDNDSRDMTHVARIDLCMTVDQ